MLWFLSILKILMDYQEKSTNKKSNQVINFKMTVKIRKKVIKGVILKTSNIGLSNVAFYVFF